MRRNVFLIAAIMLLSVCAFADPTSVLIDLKDARLSSSGYTNRTIYLYPQSMPTISSPSIVMGGKIIGTTDTNGQWLVSPVVAGLYRADVQAPPQKESFTFLITNSAMGQVNAADNLVAASTATFPAGTVAWSAAVSDARYAKIGSGGGSATNIAVAPSANISVVTNNGVFQPVLAPVITSDTTGNARTADSSLIANIAANLSYTHSGEFLINDGSTLLSSNANGVAMFSGPSITVTNTAGTAPPFFVSANGTAAGINSSGVGFGDYSGASNLPPTAVNGVAVRTNEPNAVALNNTNNQFTGVFSNTTWDANTTYNALDIEGAPMSALNGFTPDNNHFQIKHIGQGVHVDMTGSFYQYTSKGGKPKIFDTGPFPNTSAMYYMGLDVPYGLITAGGIYPLSYYPYLGDDGDINYVTNSAFPFGWPAFQLTSGESSHGWYGGTRLRLASLYTNTSNPQFSIDSLGQLPGQTTNGVLARWGFRAKPWGLELGPVPTNNINTDAEVLIPVATVTTNGFTINGATTFLGSVTNNGIVELAGAGSPTGVWPTGSTYSRTDTGDQYTFKGGAWQLIGAGGSGDVTQAGQNNFSGSNSLSGATVFNGPVMFTSSVTVSNGTDTTTMSNLTVNGVISGNGGDITNLHQSSIVDGYVLIPTNHVTITVQDGTNYFIGISSNDWFTATNTIISTNVNGLVYVSGTNTLASIEGNSDPVNAQIVFFAPAHGAPTLGRINLSNAGTASGWTGNLPSSTIDWSPDFAGFGSMITASKDDGTRIIESALPTATAEMLNNGITTVITNGSFRLSYTNGILCSKQTIP